MKRMLRVIIRNSKTQVTNIVLSRKSQSVTNNIYKQEVGNERNEHHKYACFRYLFENIEGLSVN